MSRATRATASGPTPARGEATAWFGRGAAATTGALVVVALASVAQAAGRAILLVFLALLLAAALDPIVERIRALRVPRTAAVLVVYAVFFASAAAFLLVIVPGTINQAGELASAAPGALDRMDSWARGLEPAVVSSGATALAAAARAALRAGPPAAGDIVAAGLSMADAVVEFATLLTLVFFWMTERARLQRFALSFVPASRRAASRAGWNSIERRLGGWVRGQLILMGAIGVMTGTACLVLGLPSPLLLGILAGLAESIPIAGPALGTVPALVVAVALRPEALIPLLVAYVVIHLVEGNVLVPGVMGNAVGISPFLVIASLLIGGSVGGLLGALIAIPVAAAAEVVLEHLQARRHAVTPTSDVASPLEGQTGVTDETGTLEEPDGQEGSRGRGGSRELPPGLAQDPPDPPPTRSRRRDRAVHPGDAPHSPGAGAASESAWTRP